jgi:hypothetical protein
LYALAKSHRKEAEGTSYLAVGQLFSTPDFRDLSRKTFELEIVEKFSLFSYLYIYIYTYDIHVHIYVYMCIYVYTYTYINMYMYEYTYIVYIYLHTVY